MRGQHLGRVLGSDQLGAGDVERGAVWKRILAAAGELTRTKPAEGERVN